MSDIAFDRVTSNSIDARVPQGVKRVHRPLDQPAARNTGMRGLLVRTGYGATQAAAPREGLAADAVVSDLMAAVGWILREMPRPDADT